MTPTNPILVIGATGRHGNTGEHLVTRLREEGRAVRVLARTFGERTDRLADLGAEIVRGDLQDRGSLVAALADVDLAYFTYPIADGVVPAAANYASAVREVGRNPRTVVMSMGPANPNHPSDLGKGQWLAEQVMEWAGLDLLILRIAALFHENLLVLHAPSIRKDAVFRNSFGASVIGWISGRDAADLSVAALLHPQRFDGPVTYPRGSEQFTHADIAALLSEVLGTPVGFTPVCEAAWRDELLELADNDADGVVNPAMAQHISAVGAAISRSGAAIPADPATLRDLIGREPVSLREYLVANREAFEPIGVHTLVAAKAGE
ncbi:MULTISPECIES: NmrA family NAD(P)-binding protein [Mycolicibacterium]|uniref:NmrA-like protein n=2 Tax=unclassified Mycobacterium TaxID=2642494 RepID=A0A5Q5BS79_MYCSS|nr:NmrA family NAD(P)-binding protein [Mycolicibacterium monacense]OBB58875.1 NmrA family transcriptional regulator [Mycolicibacterium monacense]OBF56548.1 NmrA family transcriptional regulator [Mycolicibacterium monacense]